jgi:hypothetical protein
MRKRFNRTWKIVLIGLVVLVTVRLTLPFFVTRHINSLLSDLPGYKGSIEDVDLHLLRGGYEIHNLKIYTTARQPTLPFVVIPKLILSVDADALSYGTIVGDIRFENPEINFMAGNKKLEQYPAINWASILERLIPLDINHVRVVNGRISFIDLTAQPEVNLYLQNLQADFQNLQNAKDTPEQMPSRVFVQASSVGNGSLSMIIKANVLKPSPDIDLDLKFENLNLQALKSFFATYSDTQVEGGSFNCYSEIAVLNGKVTGYVKPSFTGVDVHQQANVLNEHLVWTAIAGYLAKASAPNRKNEFFANVPMRAQVIEEEAPFWRSVWNIFRNSFVEAFPENSALQPAITLNTEKSSDKKELSEEKKDKKDIRKEKRKERRDRRKEKRDKKWLDFNKADKRTAAKENSDPL